MHPHVRLVLDRYHSDYPIIKVIGNRSDLYNLFGHLGFKTGVEIGVRKGDNAEAILTCIKDCHLYLVDSWLERGKGIDAEDDSQEMHDKVYAETVERFKGKKVTILRKSSADASECFKDCSLDFVYIDANHSFGAVTQDLVNWIGKVIPGGIISGHDYDPGHNGVINAVNCFTAGNKISPVFVMDTNFFWVKDF